MRLDLENGAFRPGTVKHQKDPASTIVAVLGAVTGVVGTLAGYVAGQSAGSRGPSLAQMAGVASVLDDFGIDVRELR